MIKILAIFIVVIFIVLLFMGDLRCDKCGKFRLPWNISCFPVFNGDTGGESICNKCLYGDRSNNGNI